MFWLNLPDGTLLDMSKTTGRVYVYLDLNEDGGSMKAWRVIALVPLGRGAVDEGAPRPEECNLFYGSKAACSDFVVALQHIFVSNGAGALSQTIHRRTSSPFDPPLSM